MRARTALLSLAPALLAMTMPAQTASTTLTALRDTARPLLIFGGANDMRVQQQLALLAEHAPSLRERDMRVVLVDTLPHNDTSLAALPAATFAPEEEAYARQHFHVGLNDFAVVLVGKDGGEKLRSGEPIPWHKLASTVDAMPMRQNEMHRR